MIPKVFVGTMHCGEGDFLECCNAISNQKEVDVKHLVITNLPEKEAHNALWSAWRAAKHEFNFFVKVDADTVLANESVLSNFWKLLQSNSRITGVQAPLLDYFTDGYINGLNCFSPRVTFRDTSDELFCDRKVDVDHDVVIGSKEIPNNLQPAGYHCYRATEAQAFHYGLHRALKGQTTVIELVKKAWQRNRDRTRALALLGASCSKTFKDGGFNYIDERFKLALDSTLQRYDELVKTL